MRLDFNALWVEDQPESVNSQIARITMRMANEGFSFRPTMCRSLTEVEAHIADGVFQDEVDLILVDWDLGSDIHGQDVIAKVRQVAPYKDVIFYSAHTVADLRKLAFESHLDGVYCTGRLELTEEVLGVFESLVKKVLDLDHTRGIVLGATSDIDDLVNTCLAVAHTKLDADGKAKFIEEALRRIAKKVNDFAKQGEKIKSDPSVEALFKAHMLLTSDDRLRMLATILDMQPFGPHAGAKITIKSYRNGVVPVRNKLGHLVLTPEGKPHVVGTTEGNPVSLDEMRNLRKLILGLREDFRALADALKA